MDPMEMNLPIKVANFVSDVNHHDMENNSHLVADSSEYAEHFLADITVDPLVLSSSQVSSVLSELEPSQLGASCSTTPVGNVESSPLVKSLVSLSGSLPPPSDRCPPAVPTIISLPSTISTPISKRYYAFKCDKVTVDELSWYRCSSCPFLATSHELISSHYVNLHVESAAAQLRCLNCEANFSRLHNLRHHYMIDHLAALTDLPNLTKLTIEANKRWREREKIGKKSRSVDSIETETVTAEELVEGEPNVCSDLIADAVVDLDVEASQPLPSGSPSVPEKSPANSSQLFSFVVKFSEGQEKTSQSRTVEEEAKKAEIKAEKEEKAIWKCTAEGCNLKFTSENNLNYHKNCHENGSSQWKCPECSEFFSKWSELSIHLWRKHEVDIDLYCCDVCDYKTNNLSKLMNLHRRTHGMDRPYICDICGKGFKSTKQLGNHKGVHNKSKKPLVVESANCTVCSRKFTDMRLLRQHMDNVHRGLKPYVCNLCDYSASSMSSVRMHVRSSHTGQSSMVKSPIPARCVATERRTTIPSEGTRCGTRAPNTTSVLTVLTLPFRAVLSKTTSRRSIQVWMEVCCSPATTALFGPSTTKSSLSTFLPTPAAVPTNLRESRKLQKARGENADD